MEQSDPLQETRWFGKFLRKVREGKKLSLDAVEEMSATFPERVTKSHLSRIENGHAEPSFRKLFALSQIYGMPLTTLAERFEIDLRRELSPPDIAGRNEEEIEAEARKMIEAGRYTELLLVLVAVVDRLRAGAPRMSPGARGDWVRHFRFGIIECLVHLGRYESAKVESEQLLGEDGLTADQRLVALHYFVNCCYRLGRFTVAMMGLEHAEKEARASGMSPRREAGFAALRGNVSSLAGHPEEALVAFRHALELYREVPDPFEVCRMEVNIGSVMIDLDDHEGARQILERSLRTAGNAGYDRQLGLAMSLMAELSFVQGDLETAENWAIRSNTIARSREYLALVFRNCYYLWKIAKSKGDEAGVKANEQTLRSLLSRVEENLPEADAFRAALAGGES